MSRTDRGLVILAIILMLLSLGSIVGFDHLFWGDENSRRGASVAELVEGQGDVRVKFSDEFQWRARRDRQALGFEDAVFSGEKSTAKIKIGESDLRLSENTLIVIRQDHRFKTLNLARGLVNGRLAKDERIRIQTGTGEVIDLLAVEATEIVIERKGANTGFKVISGNTQVERDGKRENLASRDEVLFRDRKIAKHDPIKFVLPERSRYFARGREQNVKFSWGYSSSRKPETVDEFILEISEDASLKQIFIRENLLGATEIALRLRSPLIAYYRVRDQKGNFSPIHKLELALPTIPVIRGPVSGSEFLYEQGVAAQVILTVDSPPPGAKVRFQLASDANFANLKLNQVTTVGQWTARLLSGEYFLRARFEFDADSVEGEWSETIPFFVREKINPLDLKRANLLTHVVIPNLDYPKVMYSSSVVATQKYLATMPPFPTFFADLNFEGYELVVRRRGKDATGRTVVSGQFPQEWLYPGLLDVEYWVSDGIRGRHPPKSHRMVIEMEAPKRLTATPKGSLSWTPILFAKAYEGQLTSESGEIMTFTRSGPTASVELTEGLAYRYRVRALGEGGRPISAWSDELQFRSADPPDRLTENDRKPAAAEKPSSIQSKADPKSQTVWERMGAWLWAGTGYSYYNVRQSISSVANVEYKNTKGPSGFLEAGFMSRQRWGALVSYTRTPGDVRVDNYPVNKQDFVWTTTSLEGLYALKFRTHFLTLPFVWMVRAGVQQHYFPFLYVDSGSRLIQGTNQLLTGSLGFLSEAKSGRIGYHWTMRYQQPMSSGTEGGNTFTVKPVTAFDGSVGTSYDVDRYLRAGLFWYGQLHVYDFNYQSQTGNNSGQQRLFYSNMEFRLGIDF